MKRIWLAVLATAILGALPAAGEQWTKTYNISGSPSLRVQTSDANIHVDVWDQKTIEATIESSHYKFGQGGLEVEEHQNGDAVEIVLRFPHHFGNFDMGNHRVDINVHMPRQGKVDLNTGDGRIELAGLQGEMNLHSGDGSQSVHDVSGRVRATTGDGHIEASGKFDGLELKTGDGRIDVRAATGSTVSEDWTVQTGDGSVNMEVPDDLKADLYLHTGDGHIDLDLPVTTEGRFKGNEVHGKLNGGGKMMTIHTGDGSIQLRKG